MTPEEATRLAKVEERSKSNTKRIDKLEEQQEALNSLATSVAVMASEQKRMGSDVEVIKDKIDNLAPSSLVSDVEELKAKPGKRWESVAEKVIAVLVAAVLGYLLSKMGL